MEDLTGKQFGPYLIVGPIGEGGMAAVYKAYQPSVERHVAIKVLPPHFAKDPQFLTRFQQEARVLANLQHPHILPVHDYGEADCYTYIVMPLIETGTLGDLLKGEPLPLPLIGKLITQIGSALDYAHARGLIHRDIKPGNVLLDATGNALLTDFGLVKLVSGSSELTATGAVLGTPAYMSPEQGIGLPLDSRSDIYSLGVVLYHMTTGRAPFTADTPLAVMFKHASEPLPAPHQFNPALPPSVERVMRKALAKQPADRFARAGEMADALNQAILDPNAFKDTLPAVHARPRSGPRRINWRLIAGGVLIALIALAAGLIGAFALSGGKTHESPPHVPQIGKVCYAAQNDPSAGVTELIWDGIQDGTAQYGGQAEYLVPQDNSADYFPAVFDRFVLSGCDLIVSAGSQAGDAATTAAKAHPRQKYMILDATYDPPLSNTWAQIYATDQGAFLAGYVAASVSQTSKVGTYGDFPVPTTEAFMDGFARGVAYYNQKNGAAVKVAGWDVATRTGYFVNTLDDADAAQAMSTRLMDEGVDVILPVAGDLGFVTVSAASTRSHVYVIGVDSDWVLDAPPDKAKQAAAVVLTSVEKRFGLSAIAAITAAAKGEFRGGTHTGTLANGEVGLAPFYDLEALIPDRVKTDLTQIKTGIVTGKIKTGP